MSNSNGSGPATTRSRSSSAALEFEIRLRAEQERRRRVESGESDPYAAERARCRDDRAHFLATYAQIYDATAQAWVPFTLWAAQAESLAVIARQHLTIVLKARQLGMTWLCLGYILHSLIFRPHTTALLFSRRDDEAIYLLGDERLRGMAARLPDWLRPTPGERSNDHLWSIANGSVARAFPTSAGDSYTASIALVDEADLVPDLGRLMRAVKPTIDGGGQMILLSRSDKGKPNSEFKRIYRGAKAGSPWTPIFLPWSARPSRDAAWYDAQRRDIESRTGSLDDLHEQYPATDTEALAPRSLDKRIAAAWLEQCYREQPPVEALGAPAIPDLVIYAPPAPGRIYTIGVDPAEGNPTSDDSALTVLDAISGEEVAVLKGKIQPSALGAYAWAIGRYYRWASILVERNNHGHAVLLSLQGYPHRLTGMDDRPGWLSHQLGKALLYSAIADGARDGQLRIHTFETYLQLASIDGSTLRAPEGELDDLADSLALAYVAIQRITHPDESDEDDWTGIRISTL